MAMATADNGVNVQALIVDGDNFAGAIQAGERQASAPVPDLAGRFLAGPQHVDDGVPFPGGGQGNFPALGAREEKPGEGIRPHVISFDIHANGKRRHHGHRHLPGMRDGNPERSVTVHKGRSGSRPADGHFRGHRSTQKHAQRPSRGHPSRDELGPSAWLT